MKKHALVFSFLILILGFVIGCSGGSKNPVAPMDIRNQISDAEPISNPDLLAEIDDWFNNQNGSVILGAFQILQDPIEGIRIVPYDERLLSFHYNVNRFLKPPYCPIKQCWGYEVVYFDPQRKIAEVDLILYNPTRVTGYDVRVIFIDLLDTDIDPFTGEPKTDNDFVILNPDGWTKILDDKDSDPDMNPYLLFNNEQMPTPEWPNPSRAFEGRTIDFERLVIKLPDVQVEYGPIYLFEASFPNQAEEVIEYLYVDQRPPMDPSITGFSFVTCGLFDHQGEDPDMHVYFSCEAVLGVNPQGDPNEIEMHKWLLDPLDPDSRVFLSWIVKVNNYTEITRIGEYPAMIRAVTPNEGDFDTYYKFKFKVRNNPGGPGHTDWDSPVSYTTYETGDAEIFVAKDIFMTNVQNATNQPEATDIDSCWARLGNMYYLYYASDWNQGNPSEDDLDLYVQKFQFNNGNLVPDGVPILLLSNFDLPGDERAPCVSPNLDFIVFQAQEGVNGDWEIVRANFAGDPTTVNVGQFIPLTDNSVDDENPTLNPFGNYMLFDSNMATGGDHDIFGMQPTPLSNIVMIIDYGTNDTEPAWNPYNQQFFVFTAKSGSPAQTDLIRAEIVGTVVWDVKNLTAEMGSSSEKHASWSPSGLMLVFQSNKGQTGDWELWVCDWDGGGRDQLTWNEVDDTAPAWAPVP